MSHPVNHGKAITDKSVQVIKYISVLSCFMLGLTHVDSALAHKVEVSADVGATLHIEPNDTPRAGETALAWFALTRKGGKAIPLAQCDCQLAVYAEPHIPGEPALLEPSLQAVNAERFQSIPGADITFPKPGIYQLQLTGKPKPGANFQPFEFKFDVTVAVGAGNARKQVQSQQAINNDVGESEASSLTVGTIPVWAIAIPTVSALGIIFTAWQSQKGKS
jgi:hypothetical protein